MRLDWGDGDYGTTARQLEPAAVRALDLARVCAGEDLLDLGCGNGNVTLLAARRGANVTAVDPSVRLLEQARRRADAEGIVARFVEGEGARVDAPDETFDVVVAVFSVIFAPDPDACVKEMLRVVRPGGRLVVTSWVAEGAINEVSEVIRPPDFEPPPSPWPYPSKIRELFSPHAVDVSIEEATLRFESASAEDWLADIERNHPFWRLMKSVRASEWHELRSKSLDVLRRGNEASGGFHCTSKYLLSRIERH